MIAGTNYTETKDYTNRYRVLSLDLSVAHEDEPLGLAAIITDAGIPYVSYMSIIEVPSAFTFKLNSTGNDAIDAAVGLEMEDFEIAEMYITNLAGAGTALINVEYRVD